MPGTKTIVVIGRMWPAIPFRAVCIIIFFVSNIDHKKRIHSNPGEQNTMGRLECLAAGIGFELDSMQALKTALNKIADIVEHLRIYA